jgi:adenylate cyclase
LIVAISTFGLVRGWYLPPAAPLMTLFLAATTRVGYESVLRLRERRKLRRAFAGYVSPDVMDEIMAGHLNPEPGGTNKFVCVMFSDIRGYTTRAEGLRPQQIIAFLNRYFERVVEIVHSHGGTVVCFMGDGIMVVFGAPKSLDDPCASAFAAAHQLLLNVKQFNATLAPDEAPVEIGIGLHAGEAVVGNVGSATRHDFTAIGDVTNVAARLEGLSKEVGFRLVFSEVIAGKLGVKHEGVPLGAQAIKGHTPVEVYGYDKVRPLGSARTEDEAYV